MTATPQPLLPTTSSPAVPPSAVQGALALDFSLPSGLPAVPRVPALTVLVGGDRTPPSGEGVSRTEPTVPAAHDWAGRFVQAVVEVIAGDRPLQQLIRWTDERVYADLSRRVRILGLTTSAASRHRTERSHVRSVHVFQPRPDAAEVAAHVRHGRRSRAVAARLEADGVRWRCTALLLG